MTNIKETVKEKIEKAISIAQDLAYTDYRINAGIEREAVAREYEKDGKSRTYINIYCYTMSRNFKGSYKCGYIDNETGEYVFGKYDDIDLGL